MKKRFLPLLFAALAFATVAFGQSAATTPTPTSTIFWQLTLDGVPLQENSTQAYCDAAAKTAGKYDAVKAKGGTAVFDCLRRIRVVGLPVAPTPPTTPVDPPVTPPSTAWVTGQSAAAEPTTPLPARGVATSDPSFKQPVYRVTDRTDPPKTFARNDYSRRQAFNATNTRQLVYALDGAWHTYNATTFAYEKKLAGPGGDAEPHWHSTNPDLLYYVGTNGTGMKLYELNVAANTSRTVSDFGARLKAKWPAATYAWTKSEGSPSADGRYWCFQVDTASWGSAGVFTWDRDTDTIVGTLDTAGDRPDHVSMSPSGGYCVVSWSTAKGTVAFTRDFKTSRLVNARSEHSDIALLPGGDDAYVAVDYASGAGDVFFVNLRTGERTVLFPSYLSGTARAFHFSGKAFGKPGWVLVSAYGDYGGAAKWMDRKVFLLELKAGAVPYNVAWHRSVVPSYFFEPHATISRDGSRVAFTSGWGSSKDGDLHAFQVRIPAFP